MTEQREWSFTVSGQPKPKRDGRLGQSGGKGAGRHFHTPTAVTEFEQRVAGAAIEAGVEIGNRPCELRVVVFLAHRRRIDDDRIKCAINDGLKLAGEAALADDSILIIQRNTVELGGIDRGNPRVEITLRVLDHDRAQDVTGTGIDLSRRTMDGRILEPAWGRT